MAELSSAARNQLPDSAFAYIEPGGHKDSSGRTAPRSLRHFPIHDESHIRNALARIAQGAEHGKEALPKVKAAAKEHGIDTSEHSGGSDGDRSWEEGTMGDTERRYTPGPVETRDTGTVGKRICGYASVFSKLSRNLGGFVEVVNPSAFNQARMLHWPGVVARYNHDSSMLLGTMAGRTLDLKLDDMGLWYDVLPPQSRSDILELVDRGDIQHSSFAFRVPPGGDDWSMTDQNYPMRSLREVQLVDVAPVLEPAYPDATAGLRSLASRFDAPLDEVRKMADDDDLRKFFLRTDRRSGLPPSRIPAPSRQPVKGAAALLALMDKRNPALDD